MTVESLVPEPTPKSVLAPVQILRAIAAAMVVVAHCYLYAAPRGGLWQDEARNLGTLGVAIFFIISGFIMYYTCRKQWIGSAKVARDFAVRRIRRIVPLYWLMTTALIAIVAAGGHSLRVSDVVQSYLFIPYGFDGIKFRPILGVGWTLNFEMFFYLLFACALLLPKRFGLPAILAVLLAFSLAEFPSIEPLAALAQPIVLLFGIGILLGWTRDLTGLRVSRSPAWVALLCVATPLSLAIDPAESKLVFLPAIWAVSLAWAVHAVFAREKEKSSRLGLLLGDASYMLYLVYPIVSLVVGSIAIRAGLTSPPERIATSIVIFICAMASAIVGHLLFEKSSGHGANRSFGKKPARASRRRQSTARNLPMRRAIERQQTKVV